MKKIVISLSVLATIGFADTFSEKVDLFLKHELNSIAKPPREVQLVRGEFETTQEFNNRVAQEKVNQQQKVEAYERTIASSKQQAQENAIKYALMSVWGKPILSELRYDADNGYFIANLGFEAKKDFHNTVAIKVDMSQARAFKAAFDSLNPQAVFDVENGNVSLKDIRITYNGTLYAAQFTDVKPNETRVAVNLKNDFFTPTVTTDIKVANNTVSTLDPSKLQDFNELDRLLSSASFVQVDPKKWLFAIGIEKYDNTDAISYATRTADMFNKIAQKRLGVPQENSYVLINEGATQAKIKTAFTKLLNRVKEGDTIYFYYNGHGVPIAAQDFQPYMLAKDSDPDYIGDERYFSLNNIYGQLSSSKAAKVVAFVDSCFSGVTDGKSVLKGVAATKMKPKNTDFDREKMVVITAGKDHQYSNGYDKKGYRMFSYFAMKDLLTNDLYGKTINDIYKNVKNQTYDASLEEYGDNRTQEPTISGNEAMRL